MILEDCVQNGCLGQKIAAGLLSLQIQPKGCRLKNLGEQFVPEGKVSQLLQAIGIDGASIAAEIFSLDFFAALLSFVSCSIVFSAPSRGL